MTKPGELLFYDDENDEVDEDDEDDEDVAAAADASVAVSLRDLAGVRTPCSAMLATMTSHMPMSAPWVPTVRMIHLVSAHGERGRSHELVGIDYPSPAMSHRPSPLPTTMAKTTTMTPMITLQ